ncbi:hypothetical protein P154DRAFT_99480 [Amniculicola lignicola CBS 123094]|uniref:Uncharacterized protein n=1 Tax=Amniculicola lignicola CBS 123094 TaxID=1392246 RepID=A0A6A5WNT3_9PLEO|nr:hypothetical protein P154DRAFT_99480 [Amniculicola lignicola CBS 123094]
MPTTGSFTVSGPSEVVLPFESQVVKITRLLAQDATQKESDKQFLKDGKPAAPDANQVAVLNACLSAATVLSFLGGPAGIVFASGLVLFQGLLSVGKDDALLEMKKELDQLQEQERSRSQLAKVKSIANIMDTQWKAVVDDLQPSAIPEKIRVDTQLTAETGVTANSLAESLFEMEDLLEWDNVDVRVTVLAALTYLFVVWNLQCRLWASLVRIEADKKEKMDQNIYDTNVTTFRIRVREMKNELNARTSKIRSLYAMMKTKRTEAVSWIGPVQYNAPAFSTSNTVTTYIEWKDNYTGKEPHLAAEIHWWSQSSTDSQIEDATKQAKSDYDNYRSGLEDFANRAIANDLAVVDQWAGIVAEAEKLLQPPAPKVPPTVDHYQATDKAKVHAYLQNAHWVSYAYSVGTLQDGDSAISPWTDWLELKTDDKGQALLPVLIIRDSDQRVETQRTVYHQRNMGASQPAGKLAQSDKILDEWKSEVFSVKGAQLWEEP